MVGFGVVLARAGLERMFARLESNSPLNNALTDDERAVLRRLLERIGTSAGSPSADRR